MQYKVIRSYEGETAFSALITEHIAQGWALFGGLHVIPGGTLGLIYVQGVVKAHKEPQPFYVHNQSSVVN